MTFEFFSAPSYTMTTQKVELVSGTNRLKLWGLFAHMAGPHATVVVVVFSSQLSAELWRMVSRKNESGYLSAKLWSTCDLEDFFGGIVWFWTVKSVKICNINCDDNVMTLCNTWRISFASFSLMQQSWNFRYRQDEFRYCLEKFCSNKLMSGYQQRLSNVNDVEEKKYLTYQQI